jgi:23S rRNA pseudouridine1911/1915/1917 synthase
MAELDHGKTEGFRAASRAQDNFRVVAEGADWIAADKPAGLLTHPTRPDGAPTLWDGLRALLAFELANRGQLSIITRLDRETSGIVLLALTAERARAFGLAMQRGGIGKEYLAIVHGTPPWEEKSVDAPIVRQGEVRQSKIWLKRCVDERGAASRTQFCVEKRFVCSGRDMALVRARPLTGRTHQIRVHLAHAGFPVVGDKIYGQREEAYLEFIDTGWTLGLARELILPRHALHACGLSFDDARGRRQLSLGLPPDMQALLNGVDPCGMA